jgi:hypothetical protein
MASPPPADSPRRRSQSPRSGARSLACPPRHAAGCLQRLGARQVASNAGVLPPEVSDVLSQSRACHHVAVSLHQGGLRCFQGLRPCRANGTACGRLQRSDTMNHVIMQNRRWGWLRVLKLRFLATADHIAMRYSAGCDWRSCSASAFRSMGDSILSANSSSSRCSAS